MKTIRDIIGIVAVALLVFWFLAKRETPPSVADLNAAFQDSIRKEYNAKEQQWEYSRLQYEDKEKKLIEFLEEKDQQLADLARRKTIRDVTVLEPVIRYDTIVNTVVREGVHYATIRDAWMEAHIVSRADSTSLQQQIHLPLRVQKETDGRITAATPVPYVDIVDLSGFTKIDPPKKNNWKYWVGGIVGGAVVYGVLK